MINIILDTVKQIIQFVISFYWGNVQTLGVIGVIIDIIVTILLWCISAFLSDWFGITELKRKMGKKKRGEKFERIVAEGLEKEIGCKVYRNILLDIGHGDTTEIDMAFVTEQGLFCVECKSRLSSVISCDSSYDKWLADGYVMDNPFLQNEYHIKHLQRLMDDEFGLSRNIPIWNLVVTSPMIEYKEMGEQFFKDSIVLSRKRILVSHHTDKNRSKGLCQLKEHIQKQDPVMTLSLVQAISELLEEHCATEKELQEHIERRKAIG